MSDEQQNNEGHIVRAAKSIGVAAARIASFTGVAAPDDAISLLKRDHETVKDLFDRFENATDGAKARNAIIREALSELKAHAAIEEEIFYPAVRKQVGADLMNEADEEHHVAKVLIAELEQTRDDHHAAKFKVLSENVRHHIKEEENEVLPKAQKLDIDFVALGRRMLARKEELLSTGFPPTGEDAMVAAVKGKGDSPAKAARKTAGKKPSRKKTSA